MLYRGLYTLNKAIYSTKSTYRLYIIFINKKTKEICPQAKEGMPCYQVVMQRETPCEFCPVKNIKGDCTNQKLEVYNPYFNLWVDVDATYVKWQGQDAIMLSCHDVTAYKK